MAKTDNPLVSIVVPIYGVENYLEECLYSLADQTYKNIEIVLVDDKSPDESGEIADDWSKKDSRFKVVHKDKNEGLNMARATGFMHSKGDFITFVDSDDRVTSDFVEKLLNAQVATGADITMCGYIHYDKDLKNPLPAQPFSQHEIKAEPDVYNKDQMLKFYLTQWDNWQHNNNTTTTHCKLFTRSSLQDLDWKSCDYSIGEDDFETMFTFSNTERYAVINNQMYLYRINPDSISNSKQFVPKYQGMPISVFILCRNFEKLANTLIDEKYEQEVYYRIYNLYKYYIELLLKKGNLEVNDVQIFDNNFPLEKIKAIKDFIIDKDMIDLIERGGLLKYLSSWLWVSNARVVHLEQVVAKMDGELHEARNELASHLKIGRSVRLFAGNVKRHFLR